MLEIFNSIWLFFQNQILGMQWLNDLVWQVLVSYFNADKSSNWWSGWRPWKKSSE